MNEPPGTAGIILDDGTDRTSPGPVCIDSAATNIDPTTGAVELDLRVNFGNTSDRIVVRGLGLRLSAA